MRDEIVRFAREANSMRRCRHQRVVSFIDIRQTPQGLIYMVGAAPWRAAILNPWYAPWLVWTGLRRLACAYRRMTQ